MTEILTPPPATLTDDATRRQAAVRTAIVVVILFLATVGLIALIAVDVDVAGGFSWDRKSLGTFVAVLLGVRVGAVVALAGLARQIGARPHLSARAAALCPGADLVLLWWLFRVSASPAGTRPRQAAH